jgi:hypothetical protein
MANDRTGEQHQGFLDTTTQRFSGLAITGVERVAVLAAAAHEDDTIRLPCGRKRIEKQPIQIGMLRVFYSTMALSLGLVQ